MDKNKLQIAGGGYIAEISTIGANCFSLRYPALQADIIRSPKQEKEQTNFLFGIPILFPPNRIDRARFFFENRLYELFKNEPNTNCSLHGTLHTEEFSVMKHTKREVVLQLICPKDKPYIGGNNDFSITVGYRVGRLGLKQRVAVENRSKMNMPLMLGFHTAFRLPFIQTSTAKDIRLRAETDRYEIERDERYLPTGRYVENDYLKAMRVNGVQLDGDCSIHCKASGKGRIYLFDTQSNCKVTYKPDRIFKYRVFFKAGDGYICLEPQTCQVNACNTEKKLLVIHPRQTKKMISYISVNGRVKNEKN